MDAARRPCRLVWLHRAPRGRLPANVQLLGRGSKLRRKLRLERLDALLR